MTAFDIIHIIYGLAPGGAENLIRDLAREQVRLGHAVKVITIGPEPDMTEDAYAKTFADDLSNGGATWQAMPTRKASFKSFRQPFAKSARPTLVHCHIFRGLAMALVKSRNVRVIYTHHNSVFPIAPSLVCGLANQTADAFISVCRSADIEARKRYRGPHGVIHNGIALDRYSFRSEPSQKTKDQPIELVNIGSLSSQKNQLKALKMIAALGPGYRLTIFGEGGMRSLLEDEISRLGIGDQVKLAGVVSDLPARLKDFDIVVQTSDWEGMPLSLIEACAAGLPILATDVGDTSSIVKDTVNGFLVPVSATPSLLSEKIQLMTEPDLHNSLRTGARESAAAHDVTVTAARYGALSEKLFGPGLANGQISEDIL